MNSTAANKSNLKTEAIAGITTFFTMAYIVIVNPQILSAGGKTGMAFGGVLGIAAVPLPRVEIGIAPRLGEFGFNKQNDAVTIYLDQNSHLPLKTSFTWRDPKDKQKNVEEEIFDNYRLEQGVATPHSITRTFNGEMTHQRFINTAKYNLPLDNSIFQATVDYDPVAPPKKR